MKQKLLIAIGLGVLILMNVCVFGWVLTDFFPGSNEPEKTVAATDDGEDTTGAEPTEEVTTKAPIDEPTTEVPTTEEATTEEIPTEPPLPETEQVFEEVRCPVYNRYPGSGRYEIGYSADALGGLTGPDSFAIEGENIAILDGGNDRIFRDGERYYYSQSISLGKFVYDRKKLSVSKITSVDDSSVVFEAFNGSDRMQYRYDLASKTIEPMGVASEEQSIKIGEKTATVIGKVGDRTYY